MSRRDVLCRDYDAAEDDHDCTCGHKRGHHDQLTAACRLCLWCDYFQATADRQNGPT